MTQDPPQGDSLADRSMSAGSAHMESLGLQLVVTARRYRKTMDAVFAERDLSDATSLPLRFLARQNHPLRQKDLADRLGIEGPTLVRALDGLVARGLVRRVPDPDDGRAKLVSATREGRALLARVTKQLDPLRESLFDGIDEADLQATLRLLERLNHNISAQSADT